MSGMAEIYTHGHQESVLRSHRWRTAANSTGYLLDELRPGMSLLDVGCGPGTITADLAALLAPGRVVGIDISEDVIEIARAQARTRARDRAGESATDDAVTNLELVAGDFRTLGASPTGEPVHFDVVHAHQVLQHLQDPVDGLRAMARLARPGSGIVAARDSDYSTFAWAPHSAALDRWREIYMAVTRHNGAEARAGRFLLGWAQRAGLSDVRYTTSTWTYATPDERTWWANLWADRTVGSSFADQAVVYGYATAGELAAIGDGWRAWATEPDAVFVVLHGEILARV